MLSVELYVKISRKQLCFIVLLSFAAMELTKAGCQHQFVYNKVTWIHAEEFCAEHYQGNSVGGFHIATAKIAFYSCLYNDQTLLVLHNKDTARRFKEFMRDYVRNQTG